MAKSIRYEGTQAIRRTYRRYIDIVRSCHITWYRTSRGRGGGGSERVPSVLRYYGTPKFLLRINIRAFIAQFTLYHSQITKSKNYTNYKILYQYLFIISPKCRNRRFIMRKTIFFSFSDFSRETTQEKKNYRSLESYCSDYCSGT